MAPCLRFALLLLLLLTGPANAAGGNPCVDAAEACAADAPCQQLRTEYVAQCLGRGAPGGCDRARCHRALRRFFARGPPALTHALLFCPCAGPACAERRRQTIVPDCAFSGPGPTPPSCLERRQLCERSRASCAPAPGFRARCLRGQDPRCLRAYAGLVGTVITPNYVDNSSARVAPWCDCAVSGNGQEECEAFRELFTRNRCLDEAIQAFGSTWPSILQDQLDPHRDAGNSFPQVPSANAPLEGGSLLTLLTVLVPQALLGLAKLP